MSIQLQKEDNLCWNRGLKCKTREK